MKCKNFTLFLLVGFIGLVWSSSLNAEVTITPVGTTLVHEEEDQIETTFTLTNSGEEEANYFIRIRPGAWEEDNFVAAPHRDDRGGPDDMEYEWRDNDENDCPNYQWIDITEFENVVEVEGVQDDSYHGMYELGFEFEYYGEVYEEIGLHSNGWASFVNAADIGFFYPQWCQEDLPHANGAPAPPPTLLAVNYQDLNPAVSGSIYFWTNEQDMAIITWQDVSHFVDDQGDQDLWTFQVILTANGLIKYQYATEGTYDNSDMMIGLQNDAQDLGFTVTRQNFEYIEAERIIAFGQPSAWVSWLSYDPVEGAIQPEGGQEQVTITVDCEDLDEGVYIATVVVNIELENHDPLAFPVILSVDSPVGSIEGVITNEAGGAPVEDAVITFSPSDLVRYSDEDGQFAMPDLPVGNYTLTCVHPDFFPFILEDVEVADGEVADGSIGLLHAEFNLHQDAVAEDLEPDFVAEIEFEASNDGNATVTYRTEKHLVGDVDIQPWELRHEIAVGEILEDTYICGVVYIDNLYYVCGGNSGDQDGSNFIYVITEEGEEINRFPQFGDSRYGMRDLAWDGELIWGGDEGRVYGFNTDGDLVVEFGSEVNPARAISWDWDQSILWVASENSDLYGYDRDGDQVGFIDKQESVGIRGLSYFPDDPDGFTQYIFSTDRGDDGEGSTSRVYKLNPDDGEIRLVVDLDFDGNRAGGLDITNQYDIYNWVFLTVLENAGRTPDLLVSWQLEARLDWMEIEPAEGEIEAGQSQQFVLSLNTFNLPDAEFEGDLVFYHDGTGGETHLPVSMSVTGGPVHTSRDLNLEFGWNLVSLNITPDDEDVEAIAAPLVEEDNLMIMKNGSGRFYVPSQNFNSIPGWYVDQAYMMRVREDAILTVEGTSVVADDPISLLEGWNYVSYYPREDVQAVLALSDLVETGNLLIAKDGYGHFYVPQQGFSNIGTMREGLGYQMKVTEDVEFSYVTEAPEGMVANGSIQHQIASRPQILPQLPSTGRNMSLLVSDDAGLVGEIGVYDGDRLVGSGVLRDGVAGIAVWGDDPTTSAIDGSRDDQPLTIRFVDDSGVRDLLYASVTGSAEYQTDSFWAIEIEASNELLPESFGLVSIYPNPFNAQSRISYNLVEAGNVDLSLFDVSGRLVSNLVRGVREAGLNSATLNGNSLTSGVYIVKLKSGNRTEQQKVILIK